MAKKKAKNNVEAGCTYGQVKFCNGVRDRINKERAAHLVETGRSMSVGMAANKLIRRLIDMENGSK